MFGKKKNTMSDETPTRQPEEFPNGDELEDNDEDWEDEPDEEDQRIAAIFSRKTPPEVTEKTLATYLAHLRKHLKMPCRVTGMEDFPWEGRFFWGQGSKREHEELKKTHPSYEDIFELLELKGDCDGEDGLCAKVRRETDRKEFLLRLDWLEAVDEESPNHQLLMDYSSWFVNHR